MLNKREINILMLLIENNDISIIELEKKFNVSKRMIQYNINNINYYLEKKNLNKIEIKDSNLLCNQKELLNFYNSLDLTMTAEDIIVIIKLNSMFLKNGLNITKLSKEINISRNTIKKYMQNIGLENFSYIYSKGYIYNANINSKMKYLNEIYKNKKWLNYLLNILDIDILNNIDLFLKEVSSKLKLQLNIEIYTKLKIYIYILITFKESNNHSNINKEKDYLLIKEIALKHFIDDNISNIISDTIIGLSINPILESWLNESYLIKKLIKNISKKIKIDLTKDTILFDFLLSHIKTSIYRINKNISLNNDIYNNLIFEYDSLLKIIKEEIFEVENTFNIKFNDEEIALITYHFKASIQRMEISNRKKTILVCGLGYGTSRILESNLKDFNIDIVNIIPSYMLTKDLLKNYNIDFILSTVDLDIDHIKINPILQNEDYEKLNKLGITRKNNNIYIEDFLDELNELGDFNKVKLKDFLTNNYGYIFKEKFKIKNKLLDILDKDKVIFKKEVSNYEEAINILGTNLENLGSVNKKYKNEIIENIKKLGPYIVLDNEIAIPHASIKNVNNVDISILILDKDVQFFEKKANILFMFCTPDRTSHLEILSDFYKLIMLENFKFDIKNIKTYESLIEYIKNNLD